MSSLGYTRILYCLDKPSAKVRITEIRLNDIHAGIISLGVKFYVRARNFSNNVALVQHNSMLFCLSLLMGIPLSATVQMDPLLGSDNIDLVVLRLCGYLNMQAGIISLG